MNFTDDELFYLFKVLKATGTPTYSDTPGRGNVAPWQFPKSSFTGPGISQWDRLAPYFDEAYPGSRSLLEKMLMNRELNHSMREGEMYLNRGPRYDIMRPRKFMTQPGYWSQYGFDFMPGAGPHPRNKRM